MEPDFEDALYEQCTCPARSSECLAEKRLSAWSAEEAVKIVSQEPPKSCLISRMIPLLGKNKDYDYLQEGIFPVFLQHILQSLNSTKTSSSSWDFPNWLIPLRGAYTCLSVLYTAPHSFVPESRLVILELRSHLPQIVDVIWKDHELLKTKGLPPDGARESVASFFGICSADKDSKAILYGDKSIEMMMTCLLEMTRPYWPNKLDFINSIDYFFNPNLTPFQSKFPVPADIMNRVFKFYSPRYITTRFAAWLHNDELLDDAINTTLLPMVRFMQLGMRAQDRKWIRAVTDSKLHIPLMRAIRRQMVDGGDPWRDTMHVSHFGMSLMTHALTSPTPYQVYTDLLTKTPFIETIARTWYLASTSSIPQADMLKMDWGGTLRSMQFWLEGGLSDEHNLLRPALIEAARISLELAYTPTLFWYPKNSSRSQDLYLNGRSFLARSRSLKAQSGRGTN